MRLRTIEGQYSICKVTTIDPAIISAPFCFVGKTDLELSLVCPTELVPEKTLARDDGWSMFGVVGSMDFSLVGILASLSATLAEAGVGIFAVSTYDTDYILVKTEGLETALEALVTAGNTFE